MRWVGVGNISPDVMRDPVAFDFAVHAFAPDDAEEVAIDRVSVSIREHEAGRVPEGMVAIRVYGTAIKRQPGLL